MKKILGIICLIFCLSFHSYYVKAQAGAGTMITYLTGVDAKKITQTVEMIRQLEEGIKTAGAIKNSVSSVAATIQQIELDAKQMGSLEQMVAGQLDMRIEALKNDLLNVEYIDFHRSYMQSSANFRTPDGGLDALALAAGSMQNNGIGNGFVSSVANQSEIVTRANLYDFHMGAITDQKLLRAIRNKEIKELEEIALQKEKKAIMIHYQISAKTLKAAGETVGSVFNGDTEAIGDDINRTRTEINDRMSEAQELLNDSRSLRMDVRRLSTEPLPLPQFEREYLERMSGVASNIQMDGIKTLQLGDIKRIKINSRSTGPSYVDEILNVSNTDPGLSVNNSELNQAVWRFYGFLRPILDAIVGMIILLGAFKVTAKFMNAQDATGMLITLAAGLVIWYFIIPEIVSLLSGGLVR